MAKEASQVMVMLSEQISGRVEKLCGAPDSPFDKDSLRARLRSVASGPANTAAVAELDRMEKLLNPEPV